MPGRRLLLLARLALSRARRHAFVTSPQFASALQRRSLAVRALELGRSDRRWMIPCVLVDVQVSRRRRVVVGRRRIRIDRAPVPPPPPLPLPWLLIGMWQSRSRGLVPNHSTLLFIVEAATTTATKGWLLISA